MLRLSRMSVSIAERARLGVIKKNRELNRLSRFSFVNFSHAIQSGAVDEYFRNIHHYIFINIGSAFRRSQITTEQNVCDGLNVDFPSRTMKY